MPDIITDEDLKRYTNPDHSLFYIKEIFKNTGDIDPAWMVELRRVGTYRVIDGTTAPAEQTMAAQLLVFDQDKWIDDLANWVAQRVVATAPLGIGAFMAPALLNDRKATDKSVSRLVTVCADFDTGNPAEKLNAVCARLGARPTIVATSGGTTAEGFPKLHAHWRLDEPCDEPWKVAYIREQLAKMYGGDASFKRIPQIIRIPGALYDKQGQWGTTLIIEANDTDTSIMQWEEALSIDWSALDEGSIFHEKHKTKSKEERIDRLHQLQSEEVTAGRTDDTRWDRFSEYAGHQIRQARFGHQSIDEAFKSTFYWVQDRMVPAWDEGRINAEFAALLQRDKVNHADAWAERDAPPITFGNAPVPAGLPAQAPQPPAGESPADSPQGEPSAPAWSLDNFVSKRLYAGEAPPERHLIENFLVHGATTALVADGGVGKTYVSIDLAHRIAAGNILINGYPNTFLGFEVLEKCVCIAFTVEDGQHDIHRRIRAIDPDGSLQREAGERCIIVPVQEQILNGFVLVEKDAKGNYVPSMVWKAMLEYIEAAMKHPDRAGLPLVVIIDTYSATHHGDENSAISTNEWFRAAGLLKKFDGTLLITHHVRKADPKVEIKTPTDMKNAIRGSSAFNNSTRVGIGIWPMPNDKAVTDELPLERGTKLFNMGIIKNNTGINWDERTDPKYPEPMITLRRTGLGRLVYDADIHLKRIALGDGKKEKLEASRAQLRAAVVQGVQWYAENGWPLSARMIAEERERFLPAALHGIAKTEVKAAVDALLNSGTIKQVQIKGVTKGGVLDVPEGGYSAGTEVQRKPVAPAMQWAQFKYDAENECFHEIENAQHLMDL